VARLRRLLCGKPLAFRETAEPKDFLFFLFPGPERPSLSAQQGKAAISSQLPTARVLERYREYREGRRTAV